MGRRYKDVFGELEEVFLLKGERLVRVLPVGGRQTGPPLGPSAAEEPTR
jgi:hypothetical protein